MKELYIFVENYSGQNREEFFEKELPYLCERFDKVIILPLYEQKEPLCVSNEKIEIRNFNAFAPCNRVNVLLKNFFLIMNILFYEILNSHNKNFYFRNFRRLSNALTLKVAAANRLSEEIRGVNNAVFYTYWFSQWTLILSIIKKSHPQMKLVTRAHGSDYKEEQTGTTLPFRYFQLSRLNAIYPVSEYAKKYLQDKFRVNPSNITVSRLGLNPRNMLSPVNEKKLVIVSCSSLISLKRVHLIPEILKHISEPMNWFHFGTGPELDSIKTACKNVPSNVTIDFKGQVPNEEFISFLAHNPVSFFINVSKYEGIPVTLLEAAGFGVPLIAPAVGGIPEIVCTSTGHLISEQFDTKELAEYILAEHRSKRIYDMDYRTKIRLFYEQHFSAANNYKVFAGQLSHLN